MATHSDACILTRFGAVSIAEHHGQLAIELLDSAPSAEVYIVQQSANPRVKNACQQVLNYLQDSAFTFDLPMPQHGTPFQQHIWLAIAKIPKGQTRTYGELARIVGSGPRAAANACGANPLPLVIPCHRVVAKNGIGGFMQGKANGLRIKQWLLQHEGVTRFDAD
ncbi:MAG: methylated-DNA--[protein]-cysteine S-methyltransferase [Methylotenera sp.]|nr:methylated-DNA--[protein]-cysteine S-methyltransferase [Methylotenera sp.]